MTGASDTSPEARARMLELYDRMTVAQKFRRIWELTEATRLMALAGLRREHPDMSEQELRRTLAQRIYGKTLVPDRPREAIG